MLFSCENVQITYDYGSWIYLMSHFTDSFGSVNNFLFPSFSLIFLELPFQYMLLSCETMQITDDEGSWISDVALYRDYFGSAEVLVRSQDIPEVTRVADVMSVTSFCREIF